MSTIPYQVYAWDKLRTTRRNLPSSVVGAADWIIDGLGFYGDASLSLIGSATDPVIAGIFYGDCIEIWFAGVRRYRGYVSDKARSDGEPGSMTITLYGRVKDLDTVLLSGARTFGYAADVSRFFADICQDVTARFPDIIISPGAVGATLENLDVNRKTAREALNALFNYCRSRAVWGIDVDPITGNDRLFLRPSSDRSPGAVPDQVILLPGAATGEHAVRGALADVVNAVTIEGGAAVYPQLLPNGSFEYLQKTGESSAGNLIPNGDFERETGSGNNYTPDSWTLAAGTYYVRADNNPGTPNAYAGIRAVEFDHQGEGVAQSVTAPSPPITPGQVYAFGCYLRPEPSTVTTAPQQVTATIQWRDGSGAAIGAAIATVFDCPTGQYWDLRQSFLTAPTGAARFDVSFIKTSSGDGNGSAVMLDAIFLQNASVLLPAGWQAVPFGDAAVSNYYCGRPPQGAKAGRNAVLVSYNSHDADGRDVHLRYASTRRPAYVTWKTTDPGYTAEVFGSQKIRLSAWVWVVPGSTAPKIIFEFNQFKGDGSHGGNFRNPVTASGAAGGWQYIYSEQVLDADTARCEFWLTLRGDGTNQSFWVDCLSARVADDPFIGEYLEAGNLVYTVRAEDVVAFTDSPAVFASLSTYGRREKAISVPEVTTISDARTWAREYLLVSGAIIPAPSVSVLDARTALPGQSVRLAGADGAAYAPDLLPLARVSSSVAEDGILAQRIEAGRTLATEQELYAEYVQNNKRSVITNGAAAGSGTAARGAVGTGGGTGPQGIQGIQGDTGATGATGATGPPGTGGGSLTVTAIAPTPQSGPILMSRNTYNRVDATASANGVAFAYSTDPAQVGSTITVIKTDASVNPVPLTIFGPDYHPNAGTAPGQNFAPLMARWQSAKFIFIQLPGNSIFAWERFV